MKVTPGMMAKFESCKSAEDVLELARREKISLTMEQAQRAFELLKSEDISEEVMEKIFGGLNSDFFICMTKDISYDY